MTGYMYVQAHGARLGWIKSELTQAGVETHAVVKGADGLYYLAISADDVDAAHEALEDVTNYQKRTRRTPLEVTALYWLLGAGVAVAALCALVSLAAGAIVLLVAGVAYYVFATQLIPAARDMRAAGGRYSHAASAGLITIFLIMVGFFVVAGGAALTQVTAGNSALVLLGR